MVLVLFPEWVSCGCLCLFFNTLTWNNSNLVFIVSCSNMKLLVYYLKHIFWTTIIFKNSKQTNKQTNFHHDLLILFELGDFQKSVVEFHGTDCNMSAFIEFFLTTSHFSRINNTISIQSDSTAGFGPLLGCQLNIVTVVFCTSFPTFWLDLCLQ